MMRDFRKTSGFTIIELMIATTVFSVIILGMSVATTTISRAYQKSMYNFNTQSAASELVDLVSQSVRFSSGSVQQLGDPVAGTGWYCIGNRQLLYTLGRKVSDSVSTTSSKYAVVSRPNIGCQGEDITVSVPTLTNHKELLGRNMRLSKLSILRPTNTYYVIEVRVVYGDNDLLCSNSVSGSCEASAPNLTDAQLKNNDLRCKQIRGSEFCSVAELSSVVYQRL